MFFLELSLILKVHVLKSIDAILGIVKVD